jgi:type I restriction enzyme S subunit
MTFPAYSAYKDSGVDWLGVVPKHWGVKPLRYLGRFRKGLTITKGDLTDGGIPCLNYGEVHSLYPFEVNQDVDPLRSVPAEYLETDPSACVKHGDFVFADTSEDLDGVGNFTHVSGVEPLFAGYHTIIYSINSEVSSRFLAYCLESFAFRTQLRMGVKGVKVFSITQEILRGGIAWLPIMAEQTQIARFLDHETARIDALIEEQQRLIELLKEKRQSVISHAVTKGLDPTVPMKDSGVEWLGEVPAHWEVRKLSTITNKITNGFVGPTRDILVDEGVRYLQSLHIKGNRIKFDVPYYVREAWSLDHKKSILESGDVLIVQTGDIGQVAVVTDEFAGCNCHALIVCSPVRGSISGEWLSWVLNTNYGRQSLLSIQTGALHPHLNCGNVKDLYIPVPPVAEQEDICRFVEGSLGCFDSLISESESAGLLLRERRSALISAAVTGKIDVRSWQPPANAQSPEVAQETV